VKERCEVQLPQADELSLRCRRIRKQIAEGRIASGILRRDQKDVLIEQFAALRQEERVKRTFASAFGSVDDVDVALVQPAPMVCLYEVGGQGINLIFGDSLTETRIAENVVFVHELSLAAEQCTGYPLSV
jgi:hypothetical protein